jgi:hypothetical protein
VVTQPPASLMTAWELAAYRTNVSFYSKDP